MAAHKRAIPAKAPARESPAVVLPEPKHPAVWVGLTYLVTTLLLGWPALLGQFLVTARSDQLTGGYAFRSFAAAWEKAHHAIPLWNDYIFGGLPYVAAMHGDTFYPTALLRLLVPVDAGMTWGLIIHVFLAGCFTYVFLRRAVGLGFFGALIGGIAYMIGGNLAGHASPGNDGKLFVAALTPLTLLFVYRAVRDGRRWAWGALALTITLDLLTPHPQLSQYLLLLSGAYALFLAFSAPEHGPALPTAIAWKRLGLAAVSVGIGMLGSAIQYWPVIEYTPWSPRAGGKGWEHAISFSMPPEELINTYLPEFSGILDNYAGRNGIHFHSEYIGAAVLVLAGLAFGARRVAERTRLFWGAALLVALVWALGGYTPFYHIVYAIVPGTKFFRAPSTMLFVVSFCTAVFAGMGVDRALSEGVGTWYAGVWLGVAGFLVLLAITGALTGMATTFSLPGRETLVDANRAAVDVGALRSLIAVGAVVAVLISVRQRAMAPVAAGWMLAGIIALDLWSVERLYWGFSPPAAKLFASDQIIDYLKNIPEPGRVVPLADPIHVTRARDPYLGSGFGEIDGFMVHGIRSVTGYHGNELGRYDELTGLDQVHEPQWDIIPDSGRLRLSVSLNAARLLNLRYLYTNQQRSDMKLLVGPVLNAAGNGVYLYALPGDNPAAWIASIGVTVPDSQALPTVLDSQFDPLVAAVFDPGTTVPTQPIPKPLPPRSTARVKVDRWEPQHISLTLEQPAAAGSVLVVSENYYPGWQATVDGRPAPTDRADYVLTGVVLPAGAQHVELTYTSARYEQGRDVTIVVVLLCIIAVIAGVASERRSRV